MKDCIFCKIINGEIPSKTIYEDETVKVFMDIEPVNDGHLLIVPKNHYEDFLCMPDDVILHVNKIAKQMQKLIQTKLNPDGLKLVNNYGSEQVVKHYHLHIIPIYLDKRNNSNIDDIYNLLTK